MNSAVAENTDAVEGAQLRLCDDGEAAAHGLSDSEFRRAGDARISGQQRPALEFLHHRLDGRVVPSGNIFIVQFIAFRNGRVAESQVIARHEYPAAIAVEPCFPAARSVGHVEGKISAAVAASGKSEAHHRGACGFAIRKKGGYGRVHGLSHGDGVGHIDGQFNCLHGDSGYKTIRGSAYCDSRGWMDNASATRSSVCAAK